MAVSSERSHLILDIKSTHRHTYTLQYFLLGRSLVCISEEINVWIEIGDVDMIKVIESIFHTWYLIY